MQTKGFRYKDLAPKLQAMGCPPPAESAVSAYRKGKTLPRDRDLFLALCRALELSVWISRVDELYAPERREPPSEKTPSEVVNLLGQTLRGREVERASLVKGLSARAQVVLGGPGAGKSMLAAHVFQDVKTDSKWMLVRWIRANDQGPGGLNAIGAELSGPLRDPGRVFSRTELKDLLDLYDRWLLVIDGAGSPDQTLQHLPFSDKGHVLITSTHAAWGDRELPCLALSRLSPEAAKDLFRSHLRRDVEDTTADLLMARLNYWPHWIIRAARTLSSLTLDLHKTLTLPEVEFQKQVLSPGAAWREHIDGATSDSQVRELAVALACLGAAGISLPQAQELVLDISREETSGVGGPLRTLVDASIVEAAGERLTMHELTRATILADASSRLIATQAERVGRILLRGFPETAEPTQWQFFSAALSQVQSWIATSLDPDLLLTDAGENRSLATELCERMGGYLKGVADPATDTA